MPLSAKGVEELVEGGEKDAGEGCRGITVKYDVVLHRVLYPNTHANGFPQKTKRINETYPLDNAITQAQHI